MTQYVPDDSSLYTETEQKLVAIWLDVLQIPAVRTRDQFIDLGGDSMAAMLCLSRLRTVFGVEVGFEDFFGDEATIAAFAKAIDQSRLQRDPS
jgi:acyl carrier protein